MLQYIILSVVCVGMLLFSVGAAYLNHEEKEHKYDFNITDEHEI